MLTLPSAFLSALFDQVAAPCCQVQRYRGILRGWQPMGPLRTPKQAALFVDTARRCLPTATLRIVTIAN